MNSVNRTVGGIVVAAVLLLFLAYVLPPQGEMAFFSTLASHRQGQLGQRGVPFFRGPARLPVPQRYIEGTRAEVRRRMAASDWGTLSLEKKREALLEILVLFGVDTEYWLMPEARQRQVADAYVRAFLLEPGRFD